MPQVKGLKELKVAGQATTKSRYDGSGPTLSGLHRHIC